VSGRARLYWLIVQLSAIGVGIYFGVVLFDWATG
jgi:hypothetical protein